jgi:hypothetical protein
VGLIQRRGESGEPQTKHTLDSQVLIFIEGRASVDVEELHGALCRVNPALTKTELVDTVWRLANRGKIRLEDKPPLVKSFADYLTHWERNLLLIGSLALSYATVLVAYTISHDSPVVAIRWVLGIMFVLFIPGYVALEALFPRSADLTSIERLSLGVVLSIGLVPVVSLLLNYTPLGIKFTPVLISLTLVTTGCAIIALIRQYNVCKYPDRYSHLV